MFCREKPLSFEISNVVNTLRIFKSADRIYRSTLIALTVNTCGVVSRIQVEHIGEWITVVAEPGAVDRKLVFHEYTFSWSHIAFAQFGGFCRMNSVR